MNFLPLIEKKREGGALSTEQIHDFVCEFTFGKIPDYQMAAMLMAIYFRGLDTSETTSLTLAMRDSGEILQLPKDDRPIVDKHSTGGVGDKASLPLAPLLACLGFRVPMISGRGLGITGGTLDKLDSIPGFQTLLPAEKIVPLVQSLGCVMCGQTDRICPADKKLYALRDVTGTVPSTPLITASILSKKLSENLDALVLDVKFGNAAFMQNVNQARTLAQNMITLGRECGLNTRALLTDMNIPLGRAAGNWLEVKESVECLEGRGPEDLRELVITCAAHLLAQTGKADSIETGQKKAAASLDSGAPLAKWHEMLSAQGADVDAYRKKLMLDHTAPVVMDIISERSGYISHCDARVLGEVIRDLGGGRLNNKDSVINYDVGVDRVAKPGEIIERGSLLCRMHASDRAHAETISSRIETAFSVSDEPPSIPPLIHEVI